MSPRHRRVLVRYTRLGHGVVLFLPVWMNAMVAVRGLREVVAGDGRVATAGSEAAAGRRRLRRSGRWSGPAYGDSVVIPQDTPGPLWISVDIVDTPCIGVHSRARDR
jgi:hypothetical protein